ncbi:MAG TPA: tetratricopeptide repeat protein, partial [Terriglobales bacterium]|nr:tetratricopeptide repeat protein [Terriglobales bacterium]
MGSRLLRALVLLGYVLSVAAPGLAVPPADKAGADELLRKGDQYVLEGKLGPARAAYEKAIAAGAELTGDYARARNLGMVYMNGAPRDFKKAARWLELAWKLSPSADDTRLALAQALSWSGKYDAAIEHYRVLVKKSPDTPDYSSGLANTLYWAGKPDEAFGVYDRYLERKPTHVAMRLEYARVLSYARRLPEATAQYNTVLQADPNNVQAQVGLAKIDSWQDDFKASLDRYNKVLKKYPNLYDAVVGKAYTLYWMGRTQEAATLFQHALKRNPNDKEVQATLKEMGMAGEKKPAVAAAQPATEPAPAEQKPAVPVEQAVLQPETFATHQKPAARNAISVMMEQAQAAANANNYVEAVHLYHEVLAKEPNNTQAMIQIARVLSWSRNFEESAKEYDQLLQLEPDNAQARLERARVLSWGQNYDASIEEYRSLIKQAELAQAQKPKPVEQPKPVEVVKAPEPKPVEQPKPVETVKAPEPKPVEQPKPVETVAIPEAKPVEQPKSVEVVKAPEPKPVEQPKPVEVAQAPAPEPVERVAPEEQAAPPAPAIDLTQTRLELARVLAWSKRYEESLAQFNQILPPEQKPEVKDKPILIEKARVLSYARNYDEAIKTYDVALALDPADIEARLGKGQTLYWWGRLDQAASVLRPLMQVQALSPESKTTTAFTLAAVEHGRGKESAALSLLDTAGDNSDVKLLRTNIQEGLRPVLRFTFGWENDQEAPGGGSLAPTTVTRALRYSTALSFNVKPDLRMTVSNTVTRATTSNPLLGKHGSDALA